MAVQTISRRIAARDQDRRSRSDGFYGKVVEFAEEARNRRLDRQRSDASRARAEKLECYKKAEAWWTQIFLPELLRAKQDLQDKNIALYETKGASRNDPASGRLEHVITVRLNRISTSYRVAVDAGAISLRKAKGSAFVAIDGFYTSVDIKKSSPSHVRLMITRMIKECLA